MDFSKKNLGKRNRSKSWLDHKFVSIDNTILSFSIKRNICSLFLLVAMYGIFNWVRDKSIKSITITILGFAIASCFHGPMIIGIFIFLLLLD